MINFIPIIYLPEFVFPGEEYNLHISTDPIKHLITDCFGENKPFGIIANTNSNEVFGVLVSIQKIHDVWGDQKMNITIKGESIFKTLETVQNIPNKLYNGAIVNYPENILQTSIPILPKVIELLKQSLATTIIQLPSNIIVDTITISYQVANYIGFSTEEKVEFLQLLFESQRLEYIRRHLDKIIPLLKQLQSSTQMISTQSIFKKFSDI